MLPPTASRSRPILVIAALAASLAVAACSATATTTAPSGPPEPSPSTATGAPSTGAAVASPTAGPLATAATEAWRLVELPDASGATQIADVIARHGFVAAAAASGTTDNHGTAWTSLDDGASWTAEPMPGSAGFLGRLVPWGDRILAIGEGDGNCPHPSMVEIWVRSSGGRWTAAPADPTFCAGGTASAAAHGPTAVIAGAGSGDVAYEWSSTDGLRWTDRSDVLGGLLPAGIAADGSGFLAVGSGFAPAAAWAAHSKDGRVWDGSHPIPGTVGMSIMGDPVEFKGDLAIFARDPAGAVGILRPDGEGGWRSEAARGLNGDTVSRFVAVGGSLVALGGDRQGPAMWVSADGTAWRALALPPEAKASGSSATLTGVAVADGHAYLVGQIKAPTGVGAVGALWTGSASLIAP